MCLSFEVQHHSTIKVRIFIWKERQFWHSHFHVNSGGLMSHSFYVDWKFTFLLVVPDGLQCCCYHPTSCWTQIERSHPVCWLQAFREKPRGSSAVLVEKGVSAREGRAQLQALCTEAWSSWRWAPLPRARLANRQTVVSGHLHPPCHLHMWGI